MFEPSDILGGGVITRVQFVGYDNVDATVLTRDGREVSVRLGCDFYAEVDGHEVTDDPDYNRFIHWLRRSPECEQAIQVCEDLMASHPDIPWTPREPVQVVRYGSDGSPEWEPSEFLTRPQEPYHSWAVFVWDVLCRMWRDRTDSLWPEWHPGDVLPLGDPGSPDVYLTMHDSDGSEVTGTIEQMAPLLRAVLRPDEWDKREGI